MAEEEGVKKKPILWARLAVNHTLKIMIAAILLPVLLGFVAYKFGNLAFSPPGGGRDFLVRNDERTENNDALFAAREKYEFKQGDEGERTDRSFVREFSLLLRNTKEGNTEDPADVDIDVPGKNILTREGLAFLKKAEDKVESSADYARFCYNDLSVDCDGKPRTCALPFSITQHPLLYGVANPGQPIPCGRKQGSELVSAEAFEAFKKTLVDPQSGTLDPLFSIFLGKDITTDKLETQVMRSYLRFGTPIANTTDEKTDKEKSAAFEKWAIDVADETAKLTYEKFHIYIDSFSLFGVRFNPVIFRDLTFAIGAIVAVFFIVLFHTTSPFLAGVTILQVVLSFPLALFVYAIIFRITYFATLQVMTIFLILGIGADDVFVFTDAWKQAPMVIGEDATLEERMSYAYKRAGKAMSVTSFTTAIAFFATALSPIVPISTFGVFAALLVLLQFFLVMTIYPSALIVWYRFWRPKQWWRKCCGKKSESTENEYRPIERFFNGFWNNWTKKLRYPLVVIAVALIAVSIWLATKLETPPEAEKFLPDDFPAQKASLLVSNAFPAFDDSRNVNVRVAWGLSGVNRDGIGRFNFDDVGEPILDDDFSLVTASAQQRVLESCSFFAEEKGLVTKETSIQDRVVCWMQDFATYRTTVFNESASFKTYSSEKELATEVLGFAQYTTPEGTKPYAKYLRDGSIGFDESKEKIIFIYNDFVIDLKEEDPYSKTWPVYEEWEDALNEFNSKTTNKAVDEPFQAASQWSSAVLQRALVRSMYQGIGIVMAVSIVALSLSTGNVIVSVLTLVSIGGILACVLAFIQLAGWALGIIESIGVVLSVGFSFDYAAHLANAYTESKRSDDRNERTRAALTELGISILAGAASTLAASAMLFFAIVVFFTKIGILIFATIVLALIWSLVFLPAFLHSFGPSGNTGEIYPFLKKILPCFGRSKKSAAETADPASEI